MSVLETILTLGFSGLFWLGRSGQRETHLGGRGAGLAGYRIGGVLSGAVYRLVLVMRLLGCVSGVGWVTG